MAAKNTNQKKGICQVCGKTYNKSQLYPAELIRPGLAEYIKESFPDLEDKGYVCLNDLHKYRIGFVGFLMKKELGEAEELEQEVIHSLEEQELVSRNVNTEFDEKIGFGDRLADKIASFGGSWKFIILFGIIMFSWISINTYLLLSKPFDPYPFILLNLILSCLAALQAPVIMMSQNRQESKDRLRSEHDYKVNLKAELEIRHLNEKLDFLLMKQWQRLLEIQGMQTELMEEILEYKSSKKPGAANKQKKT